MMSPDIPNVDALDSTAYTHYTIDDDLDVLNGIMTRLMVKVAR